jgi:hypothetical protein
VAISTALASKGFKPTTNDRFLNFIFNFAQWYPEVDRERYETRALVKHPDPTASGPNSSHAAKAH